MRNTHVVLVPELHECFFINHKRSNMKSYILILSIVVSVFAACKSKKETTSTAANNEAPKVTGVVSHQYKSTGCSAVIIIKQDGADDITLIPKDKLDAKFDVDGLNVSFNYIPLKMPQPAGCTTGMPAEISNISKTK